MRIYRLFFAAAALLLLLALALLGSLSAHARPRPGAPAVGAAAFVAAPTSPAGTAAPRGRLGT